MHLAFNLSQYRPISSAMETISADTKFKVAAITVAALSFAAVTGLAFAAWADKSAEIFLIMTRSGLNWCL